MANSDPSKTEKPTDKKIAEARKDGNVHSSQDVLSFGMLLGATLLFFIIIPFFIDGFKEVFHSVTSVDCRKEWGSQTLKQGGVIIMFTLSKFILPFLASSCLLAIVIMRIQVGKYFSMKALKWKFEALNPKSGFKQLLPSKKNIIKLLITIAKISVVGSFMYFSVIQEEKNLLSLTIYPLSQSVKWIGYTIFFLTLKILIIIAILAIIDFIVKKKQYLDNLMMTKQEIKDERKNIEGDPLIKGKIRQKMRQLLMSRMVTEVPGADVVITNPTHVAVAIKYGSENYAPKIVAKGLRKRALKIKEIAKLNDVPIVEAPPLARSLYRNGKIGEYIAPEFFKAVAAILAKIYNIKNAS